MFQCVLVSCIDHMHAKCMCMLLLLIQCMHSVHSTFSVRVSVRFCCSVGIMVSGGGGGGQRSHDLSLTIS